MEEVADQYDYLIVRDHVTMLSIPKLPFSIIIFDYLSFLYGGLLPN